MTRTGVATFAPDGSEQDALAEFSETPFTQADLEPELDERIQNLDFREDTVLSVDNAPGEPSEPGDTDVELLDLRELSGTVNAELMLSRDAAFDNFAGFYKVLDTAGCIDTNGDGTADLSPGDAGYTEAAIANRETNINLAVAADGTTETLAAEVMGGALYAPFLIANGRPESFDQVYFTFPELNPGAVDHIQGNGTTFAFEDLPFGGDLDYNDLIVTATINNPVV